MTISTLQNALYLGQAAVGLSAAATSPFLAATEQELDQSEFVCSSQPPPDSSYNGRFLGASVFQPPQKATERMTMLAMSGDKLDVVAGGIDMIGGANPTGGGSGVNGKRGGPPNEPGRVEIDNYLCDELELEGNTKVAFDGLSPLARDGLYVLSVVEKVPPNKLREFLASPCSESAGGHNQILRTVALLYDRNVDGIGEGFRPGSVDQKFLSGETQRTYSLYAEYWQALWLASNTDAVQVSLAKRLSIDWTKLSSPLPAIEKSTGTDYRSQTSVEVDILVQQKDGKKRIVEVKTSLIDRFAPSDEKLAQLKLQAIRHALLVRQHNLAGIEYVIEAAEVSTEAVRAIEETFRIMRVPFLVRIEGGERRASVQNGLTYNITEGSIPEARTRLLPQIPPELFERETAAVAVDEEAEAEPDAGTILWNDDIKNFLQQFIATGTLKLKRLNLEDFIAKVRTEFDPVFFAELVSEMEDFVDASPEVIGADRTKTDRQFAFLLGRKPGRISAEAVRAFVRIAAIVTAAAEHEDDRIQNLIVNKRVVEGQLWNLWETIEDDFGALTELAMQHAHDLLPIGEELNRFDPDNFRVGLGDNSYSLRRMLAVMRDSTGEVDWNPALFSRFDGMFSLYDRLSAKVEAARLEAQAAPTIPVELSYEPIPRAIIMDIARRILNFGPLLPTFKSGQRRARTDTKSRKLIYSEDKVLAIYDRLVLYRVTGSGVVYFYQADLNKIENVVAAYLAETGLDSTAIPEKVKELTEYALLVIGEKAGLVESLENIIPENFVRSDLVKAENKATGVKLDVTKIVSKCAKHFTPEKISEYVRVALLNRRKIYFTDWKGLVEKYPYVAWNVTTFDELEAIFGNSDKLLPFIEALNEERGKDKIAVLSKTPIMFSTTIYGKGKLKGRIRGTAVEPMNDDLKIFGGGRAGIVISFNEENGRPTIQSAPGSYYALRLALAFYRGGGKNIDIPLEMAFVAGLLSTTVKATDEHVMPGWKEYEEFFSRRDIDPIAKLIEIRTLVDHNFKVVPDEVVFAGSRHSDGHTGKPKIYTLDEYEKAGMSGGRFSLTAKKINNHYMLTAAQGPNALDLAAAWFSGHGVKIENPVEKSLIANLLGIRTGKLKKGSKEDRDNGFTVEQFESFISRSDIDPIARLVKIRHTADPRIGKMPERVVITANSRLSRMGAIKVRTPEEVQTEGTGKRYLHIYARLVDGRYVVDGLSGTGSASVGLSWLLGRGYKIENNVEKALLGRLWGTRFYDEVTREMLTAYMSRTDIDPFKRFGELRSLIDPYFSRNGPLVFVGYPQNKTVSGLSIFTPEEYEKHAAGIRNEKRIFRLKVNPKDGNYILNSVEGAEALCLAIAWLEGRKYEKFSPIEIALLSSIWDITNKSADEKIQISTWVQLVEFLSRTDMDPIARMAEIRSYVDPDFDPKIPELTFVGRKYRNRDEGAVTTVYRPRILSGSEVDLSGTSGVFSLTFKKNGIGAHVASCASGKGALELGLAWFSGRGLKDKDLVERYYVARMLGLVMSTKGEEQLVSLSGLAAYLARNDFDPIERLLRFRAIADEAFDISSRSYVLVGRYVPQSKALASLRLLLPKEVDSPEKPLNNLHLVFERDADGGRFKTKGAPHQFNASQEVLNLMK